MTSSGALLQDEIDALLTLIRTAAREEILPRYRHTTTTDKQDGTLLTEADTAMEKRVGTELQKRWPQIGFLGEEMSAAERQAVTAAPGARFWCLDPVDGTTNYSCGTPFFSVSLALIDQEGAVFGAVYDPLRDEMFSAVRGQGAHCNERPLIQRPTEQELKRLLAVVDFKRLPSSLAAELATQRPFRSHRNFGSCALEWAWLADARYDVYLHGGMRMWDYAAGWLLLQEAGGQSGDYDNNMVLRVTDAPVPVVAARNAAIYSLWYDWIARNLQHA
jgi:myo-inositol-1(or 4)-monophosphatase